MSDRGVHGLLLSHGADLPWLTGYSAMPLERLTMLVLPVDAEATLVVPALEAPRVSLEDRCFRLRAWSEDEDPLSIVAALVGRRRVLAVSGRAWASSLLGLQQRLPSVLWRSSSEVTSELRSVKDPEELEVLAAAGSAADRVADALVAGEIPLVGRSEAQVSEEIAARLRAEGHSRVNFAIVASGPNSASPHHEPSARRIGANEPVVCDFGGVFTDVGQPGYCSDITRTVFTGEPGPEFSEMYSVLRDAQSAAVCAATVGRPCEDVDGVARRLISDAGYGQHFIHRTGHGIGIEEHEDPYIISGNTAQLAPGQVFSVEPGIYLEGRHGARIEDIVVATETGPRRLNSVDRALATVEV